MEVRPGYKQTEVGVIPQDWTVKPLGEVGESLIGLTYKPTDVRSDGILVLRASNIHQGTLRFDDNVFVDADVPDKIMVRTGDILICVRSGSRDLIGKCAQIDDRARGMTFGAFMAVFRTLVFSFVYHQFQSSLVKRQIFEHLGATINQITNKSLNSFRIPFPPTKAEQDAIAEALSDADALVESLELLLEKKRKVKQGAMQELLTGKKRLPGFSGEWDVKRMGDCFVFVSTRNTELNDNVVTISAQQGFVRQEEFFKKRVASSVLAHYYLIERGHFAYNRSYSNGYPFGAIKRLTKHDKGVVTTLYICFALKPEAESDPTFFEHYFEAGLLNAGLSTVTNEGGRAHGLLNITKADFFSREIKSPLLPEQTIIAAVLSDMDAEIAGLEVKLAKATTVKQGMMQGLLTGKIRLV